MSAIGKFRDLVLDRCHDCHLKVSGFGDEVGRPSVTGNHFTIVLILERESGHSTCGSYPTNSPTRVTCARAYIPFMTDILLTG